MSSKISLSYEIQVGRQEQKHLPLNAHLQHPFGRQQDTKPLLPGL